MDKIAVLMALVVLLGGCVDDLEPLDLPSVMGRADAGVADAGPREADAGGDFDMNAVPAASGMLNDAGEALLPAALKGYELYAWSENGHLYFTLIAGTNRQKTLEEIMSRGGGTTTSEASPMHGVGSVELSRILMRVPRGTAVIFATLPGLPALEADQRATVERLITQSR